MSDSVLGPIERRAATRARAKETQRQRRASFYLGGVSDEIRAEAERLGTTVSAIVRKAWRLSRAERAK